MPQTPEQKRAYHANYYATHKQKAKNYYATNKDKIRAQQAAYAAAHKEQSAAYHAAYTKANPHKCRASAKKMSELYPERKKARGLLGSAIKAGRLPTAKTLTCPCGAPAREYHHHNGYGPGHELDVIAVCLNCHTRLHHPAI